MAHYILVHTRFALYFYTTHLWGKVLLPIGQGCATCGRRRKILWPEKRIANVTVKTFFWRSILSKQHLYQIFLILPVYTDFVMEIGLKVL